MNNAIIYLHGFNSASLDLSGNLLSTKEKLIVLDRFCQENRIRFCAPNVDYRHFAQLIGELTRLLLDLKGEGYNILFMGSSMGGFASEYMGMKTSTSVIMINPAISPSDLLVQFIGVSENFEIKQSYDWTQVHCDQYKVYEDELTQSSSCHNRTILLDMDDQLIDASKTIELYKERAKIITYPGGTHGFEHIEDALPEIYNAIYD